MRKPAAQRFLLALLTLGALSLLFAGCESDGDNWRDQLLPSGKTVKVTSFRLVWGSEHDLRLRENDSFALEYISNRNPDDVLGREQEAEEVFELVRLASEGWGFRTAVVTCLSSGKRTSDYDVFIFTRARDGKWSLRRYLAKGRT
jgi:hypothetical protein